MFFVLTILVGSTVIAKVAVPRINGANILCGPVSFRKKFTIWTNIQTHLLKYLSHRYIVNT